MRKTIQRLKNERGLTLVELLAVIVILAIIAVIAFVFIGGIIENSKQDAHIANAQQIISAAKLSEATGGDFPTNVEDLQKADFLDVVLDPWEKEPYGDLDKIVVNKTEGANPEYSISGFSVDGCKLADGTTEEEILKGDRDTLCTE